MLILRYAFILVVLLFLAAPLVVIFGVSVNEPKQLLFPPEGFSLRWYAELFQASDWLNALRNSVVIALGASTIAVSIALPLALYVWKKQSKMAQALFGLGVAPFLLPPVISALGFMIFWITVGFYGQIYATIISHGVFLVTLPLVTISLGLEAVDRQLIEASRTMGANDKTVFRTVIFPLARPYMISGFAFVFVLSLNEYIIAYMVAGFTAETLPIKIFNSLRYGYTPVMASVAVFFVLTAIVVFGSIARFGDLPRLLGAERARR